MLKIRSGHLLMKEVPYVTPRRRLSVEFGFGTDSEWGGVDPPGRRPRMVFVDFHGELPFDNGSRTFKIVINSGASCARLKTPVIISF